MQTIKEKLNEMNTKREAKAEAREEENAEKELEKVRVEVAHEVRKAKEAEAAMNLHAEKAAAKMAEQENKPKMSSDKTESSNMYDPYTATMYGSGNRRQDSMDSTVSNAGSDCGSLPANNL